MHDTDRAVPTTSWRRALDRAGDAAATFAHELRARGLPWIATAFGTGVGLYFAAPVEPSRAMALAMAAAAVACAAAALAGRDRAGFLALLVAALLAGLLAAQVRTNAVAAPVLGFRYYGPVEGRVVEVDRSPSGRIRVTLDAVRLDRVEPARTPRRVRLSLHSDLGLNEPVPGQRIMTTAHLMPPSGPVEPGGFDFQRHAWFEGLGAVGYAQTPVLLADDALAGGAVNRLRGALSAHLREILPGDAGAVAAAIVTGDRSAIGPDVTAALRDSNLAHLLAISGLHMGLLVGIAYGAVRFALALVPAVALNHPIRAWAAAAAIPVATGYLVLSGGSVATQRAFVMAVVMLGAVILGRRAVSLRSLALAGLIVLALRPEALTGPGFQMSFAATGALILAFDALSRREGWWRRGIAGAVAALVVSSLVAGLATAPFAAAHFNRVGHYGLLANVLAVPAMGAWVMPLLLAGIVLEAVGLGAWAIALAGWGIEWILAVARLVASLDGAVAGVPAPPATVLPALGLALAVFACAGRAGRVGAAAVALAASVAWAQHRRPDVLIADDGAVVGILGSQGRWLSRAEGGAFAAEVWLENDGDLASQAAAAARDPTPAPTLPTVVATRGLRAAEAARLDRCRPGTWIVATVPLAGPSAPCTVLDVDALRLTGSLAVTATADGYAVATARGVQGLRPWTGYGLLRWTAPRDRAQ